MLGQRPRRFWKQASVQEPTPPENGFAILLDGRPVRLSTKTPLRVPTFELADAIAAEWNAQGEHLDPGSMPLTQIANTAQERVAALRPDVIAELLRYVDTDVLCYYADEGEPLAARQHAAWSPLLTWAEKTLGAQWQITSGIMPIEQPAAVHQAMARALEALDIWALTAFQVAAPVVGSPVIAYALVCGHVTAQQAFTAAFVDELAQAEEWGEDWEAVDRRDRLQKDLIEAHEFLHLLGRVPAAARPLAASCPLAQEPPAGEASVEQGPAS